MKKINLSRITIKTLEGQEQQVDIKNAVSNYLYYNGMTSQEMNLGEHLHSNDENVTDEEAKIILDALERMKIAYIVRQAVAETLGIKIE